MTAPPRPPADWGTRVSLLIVVAACLALAWRWSPGLVPVSQAREAVAPAPAHPEALHANAISRSPLEALFNRAAASDGGSPSGFRLDAPERTVVLPAALDEISDLASSPGSGSLWAVSNVKGTLYRIALDGGAVTQTIEFAPRGDFEGVEEFDGGVLIARSDGMLFTVDLQDGGTSSLDTHLGLACNLEGIAVEPNRHRLLLACKSELPKMPKSRRSFGVYAMSLESHRLQQEPVIVLSRQAIDDYLGTHPNQPRLKAVMGEEFAPSAIAVHPRTGEIFLLSARGTMLVVLTPSGSLRRVEGLVPEANPQPKGIAFGADGTLYLANEARGAHALLQGYAPVSE